MKLKKVAKFLLGLVVLVGGGALVVRYLEDNGYLPPLGEDDFDEDFDDMEDDFSDEELSIEDLDTEDTAAGEDSRAGRNYVDLDLDSTRKSATEPDPTGEAVTQVTAEGSPREAEVAAETDQSDEQSSDEDAP